MKLLIYVSFLFTSIYAKAQGRFVPVTYTSHIENNSCWGGFSTIYDYTLSILDDTTVKLSINVKYHNILHSRSFTSVFYGNGKINGDTLSVLYTLLPSVQNLSKYKKSSYYVPAFNELIIYPPKVFVMKRDEIEDSNHDFPILKRVSPAMAMNWQNRSVKAIF